MEVDEGKVKRKREMKVVKDHDVMKREEDSLRVKAVIFVNE